MMPHMLVRVAVKQQSERKRSHLRDDQHSNCFIYANTAVLDGPGSQVSTTFKSTVFVQKSTIGLVFSSLTNGEEGKVKWMGCVLAYSFYGGRIRSSSFT